MPSELAPESAPRSAAAAPAGLRPHFPGEEPGTGIVLYGSRPGVLRAHWRLAADDLGRAGGSFPRGDAPPLPVVRLRRAHPDGGAEAVDEASLGSVAREGSGAAAFQVTADHGRYHAELGLSNGGGGWLLLARSNELDNVSRVGVGVERVRRDAAPPPIAVEDPEPALAAVPPGALAAVFPLVTIAGMDAVAAVDGPTPVAASAGLPPRTGLAVTAQSRFGDLPAPGPAQPALEVRPLRLPRPGGPGEGAAAWSGLPPDPVTFAPRTPLAYGQPVSAVAGLQVEAELRITGQAAPGGLIDLFGHPFRVGPGGRFQLVVRVDDPRLLRQALALNPPPELTLTRDP